jgi:hypothetical protein
MVMAIAVTTPDELINSRPPTHDVTHGLMSDGAATGWVPFPRQGILDFFSYFSLEGSVFDFRYIFATRVIT